jgi:2'-5' RNA ligase
LNPVRSFVAFDLSEDLRRQLDVQIARLRSRLQPGAIRWVPSENIHLTLKFLGEVPAERLPGIQEMLRRVASAYPPIRMRVRGLGCFPKVSRPRVVWVGVEDATGSLARLHRDLEEAFFQMGFAKESRGFHPHLTLGRVRRQIGQGQLRVLSETLETTRVGDLGQVRAEELCLFRSELRPSGAVYTCLAALPMASAV